MQVLQKNIYQKYNAIIYFIVFALFYGTCIASSYEDAIAALAGVGNSQNIANGNEGKVTTQATEIKPATSSNIEKQLAQIETNYKAQIDASKLEKNHDPLKSDLSNHTTSNSSLAIVGDIKELTDKNSPLRKRIKIANNDELLIASQNLDEAVVADAASMVTIPAVGTDFVKIEDKILTCHEAGDEVVKKCYRTLIVKSAQPEDIKFITEVYFSAQSYSGHSTTVDLKTGQISYHGSYASNEASKVINPFNTVVSGAEIISIRHIESRWWDEASVHTDKTENNSTEQPSMANNYVYTNNIIQRSVGGHKKHRNKYHGRVEKWEVIARHAPILTESWDDGDCAKLAEFAQNAICEGPVVNLLEIGTTKSIAGYPIPVVRPHWQEEYIYICGGDSHVHECAGLRNAGCRQIDSQCIKTKGPFCVKYLQTFNCGKRHIASSLKLDGTKMSISTEDNIGANEHFDIEDFGNAVAQMSMVEELQKNIVRDGSEAVLLFKGDKLTCDKEWGSDIKNCCNLKGVFKNILGHKCPKEVEEVLAPAVIRQKRCVEVAGWQCTAKVMGKCRKWQKSFCCYQGRLARIFQQIAHHQLGISWGSAEQPNCAPLDPHTFGKLNFDEPYARELLKELVDEASINAQKYADNANTKLANNTDLNDRVKSLQDRISAYYQSKTNGAE